MKGRAMVKKFKNMDTPEMVHARESAQRELDAARRHADRIIAQTAQAWESGDREAADHLATDGMKASARLSRAADAVAATRER